MNLNRNGFQFLAGNLSTITDIFFFLWNSRGRDILFFFFTAEDHSNFSFVFLTIHEKMLIARGQRDLFFCLLFAMVATVVDTM